MGKSNVRGWRPVMVTFVAVSVVALVFGPSRLPWEKESSGSRVVQCDSQTSCGHR